MTYRFNQGGSVREYQRLKNNKYILPRAVYNQTLWRIRDYYRLKETADDMITNSRVTDGMPRVSGISDHTSQAAEKRERYLKDITVIEEALKSIPEEYQKGVWNGIMFGEPYPLDADRTTYGRYKSKFIFKVAMRFGLI